MKRLLAIAFLAAACGCARRSGEVVPFPFRFPEESDGCAAVYVRKLSERETESIHVRINMMELGQSLRPQLAGTGKPLSFHLSPTQNIASCWIDEFPFKPDGFRWGHFMPPTNLVDRWNAVSGIVTLQVSRHPEGVKKTGFLATVRLSDVAFQSSNTLNRTTLDSLSFTNVHVGWWSE